MILNMKIMSYQQKKKKNLATYWLDMCDGLFIPGGSKISPYDYFILEEALKKRFASSRRMPWNAITCFYKK